jgi:hypothetical protein
VKRAIVAMCLAAGRAVAAPDPTLAQIEHDLPAGWTMLATDTELVLRHDRPCYVKDSPTGPLYTLELRFRLEPKWTDKQLADAKAANDKVLAEVQVLVAKYRIASIPKKKYGGFEPRNADERARFATFVNERDVVLQRIVSEPLCDLGQYSVFDAGARAALHVKLEPKEASLEALEVMSRMVLDSSAAPDGLHPRKCWTGKP